ncbi:MAG: hypothetical protein AB8H47_13545 [Bacteroidia bacterium]
MKAFYAVGIGILLLLLAACPFNYTFQPSNLYFNGPVKKARQRIYGLGINSTQERIPSVLPFHAATAQMPERTFPSKLLWLQAWDMQLDSLGRLISQTDYLGEGERIRLQNFVKYAWDSLGCYEQIRGEAYNRHSNTFDSSTRSYNPQTHIWKHRNWKRGDDTPWNPLPISADSIFQVGDFPIVYFSRDTVLKWFPDSVLTGEHQRLMLIKKQRYGAQRIDTILYQAKKGMFSRITVFSLNRESLRQYDQQGRLNLVIEKTFKPTKDSLWVRQLYQYDTIEPYYFVERYHKFFAIGEWNIEIIKEQFNFDQQGRLINWEERLTKHGKTTLVYAYRFTYAEDGSSIRKDYLSYGKKLDLYELYTYDQYTNPTGYEKQSGFLEGHKRDSIHVSLDSLTYDAYGNWTKAVYTVNAKPLYRLVRTIEYD